MSSLAPDLRRSDQPCPRRRSDQVNPRASGVRAPCDRAASGVAEGAAHDRAHYRSDRACRRAPTRRCARRGSHSPRSAWPSSSRWSTTRCCRSRCPRSAATSGAAPTALQWVTGAYSLTFGGLLLTAGSVADRLGRRRVLLVGLAVFGLLSLCVVFVTTTGELIALRAALGIAAAAMAPITNSLVFRLFDDKALRMRAITVMIVVGMSGFILGPLLGGTALAHVRWEWLLLVNAPIALIACIGVRLGVAADRPEDLTDDRARSAGRRAERRHHRAGLLLADQRRRARLALRGHARVDPRRRGRGRRLRAARAPQRLAHARSRPVLERHRPRRRDRADRDVDRHGQRDVRADPALPVRLRLEPGAGRPREPADHHHHDRRDAPLRRARKAIRPPHRLPGRCRPPGRRAGRPLVGRRPRLPRHRGLDGAS